MEPALDMLRRQIRELEGRPVALRGQVQSGWGPLDACGGLPRPGIVSVQGAVGSGAMRVLLALAAACTARGERVVWVEPQGEEAWPLHPPTAAALGVDLSHLLLVRVGGVQGAWAAEQAAASGACGLVVVQAEAVATAGARLVRAAWRGHAAVVVHGERAMAGLAADVVVRVRGERAAVVPRRGRGAAQAGVPAWPEGVDPWR